MDKERLIKETAENELMQFLGVKIVEATADRVVLTMEVTPKVHQYVGIMNGGVSLYLCETAASVGTVVGVDLTKFTPVGIEINANHVRGVRAGHVTGVVLPLHLGNTTHVWDIKIYDENGKLVCVSRLTVAILTRK